MNEQINSNFSVSGYSQNSEVNQIREGNSSIITVKDENIQMSYPQQESDFEELYLNDIDSNYMDYNSYVNSNPNFNFKQFYEDLGFHKWERVISEENVDDEECKERQNS